MNNSPLEDYESMQFATYLNGLILSKKILVYTHTANETYTKSWKQKQRNVSMGVKSGIPDYVIVTKNNVIFVELKRIKGGVVSPTQKTWLDALPNKSTMAFLAKGHKEAIKMIEASL